MSSAAAEISAFRLIGYPRYHYSTEIASSYSQNKGTPTVFISSTSEDLKPYRQAARDAAISARFHPEMMEYFLANGQHPPLEACRAKVAEADVVVVIVAHRYGWVPDVADPKSITWLECLEAQRHGTEVLAFLVDDGCEWPVRLRESYRVTEAFDTNTYTQELPGEVHRNIAKLVEFKKWLNRLGIRATSVNPEDLRGKVTESLRDWRKRHTESVEAPARRGHDNPTAYLEYLREQTGWIDIRGLQVVGHGFVKAAPPGVDRRPARAWRFVGWPSIRVMLTALAVVHWNERRLPEQRADLYDSILTWLPCAREKRPGRQSPERGFRCVRDILPV